MQAELPTHLYHYYEASGAPFRSLSDLSDAQFNQHMETIANQTMVVNRFATPELRATYLRFRRYTERVIRARFISKGGNPELDAPRYLTLGPSRWFDDWYEQPREISIELATLDPAYVSFTYPDSMTSLLMAEDRFEPYRPYKQPHHGQVFTLAELTALVARIGLPDPNDATNQRYGNLIVEAQLWSERPLRPWLPPPP